MRRLYKSRKNKVIDGVCGGIAEYFAVDPVLVRIIFVILFFMGGTSILAYIIAMIIIPKEPLESVEEPKPELERKEGETTGTVGEANAEPVPARSTSSYATSGALVIGILLVLFGAIAIMDNFHWFGGIFWWARHHFWDYVIPGFIIAAGLALIIKGVEK
jgi:phage shock protein C